MDRLPSAKIRDSLEQPLSKASLAMANALMKLNYPTFTAYREPLFVKRYNG